MVRALICRWYARTVNQRYDTRLSSPRGRPLRGPREGCIRRIATVASVKCFVGVGCAMISVVWCGTRAA